MGEDEQADHANEQKILQVLAGRPRNPYLIQCIYQVEHNTFLELAPGGSLAMLLNENQKRDWGGTRGIQVLEVLKHFDSQDIRRWMQQLRHAAAGLEDAGLVHGDIRPGNIFFSADWTLKLGDFDRSVSIGNDLEAVSEPFGRLLSIEDGEGSGSYGKAGARTENFALGSVYYTLLRGREPYEDQYWGREHYVIMSEKFQHNEFPPLTDSAEDNIIRKCWNGKYYSIKELLSEFVDNAAQDNVANKDVGDDEQFRTAREECKRIVESGILDTLERC